MPLVAMVSKDMATLSQQLQCIMLHKHQYNTLILYKPGSELYIVDWLSYHHHVENKDQEIPGMNASICNIRTSVDVPVSTSIEDIQAATEEDPELQMLQKYIIKGWLHAKEVKEPRMEKCWLIRHVAMRGKYIIIPCLLQKQILEQLYSKHMGIEKACLLMRERVHCINMNADTEQTVKQYSTCLKYQHTHQCEAILHYDIPCKGVVVVDVFMIYKKNILCIVDYYSKFPVVKEMVSLSVHDLVQAAKMTFAEFGLPRKIVSNARMNLTSETFKEFCRKLNFQQSITSFPHHLSNDQIEACIKFVKCTIIMH